MLRRNLIRARRWWSGSNRQDELTTSLLEEDSDPTQTTARSPDLLASEPDPLSTPAAIQIPVRATSTSLASPIATSKNSPPLAIPGGSPPSPAPAPAKLLSSSGKTSPEPTVHHSSSDDGSGDEKSTPDSGSRDSAGSEHNSDKATVPRGHKPAEEGNIVKPKPIASKAKPDENTVVRELFAGDQNGKSVPDFEMQFVTDHPDGHRQSADVNNSKFGTQEMAELSQATNDNNNFEIVVHGQMKKACCPAPFQRYSTIAASKIRYALVGDHWFAKTLAYMAIFTSIEEPLAALFSFYMIAIGQQLRAHNILTQEIIEITERIYPAAVGGIIIALIAVAWDAHQNRLKKSTNTGLTSGKISAGAKSAAFAFVLVQSTLNTFFNFIPTLIINIFSTIASILAISIRCYNFKPIIWRHPGQAIEQSASEIQTNQQSLKFAFLIIIKSIMELSGAAGLVVYILHRSPLATTLLDRHYHEATFFTGSSFGFIGGIYGIYRSRNYPHKEAPALTASQFNQFVINFILNLFSFINIYSLVDNVNGAPSKFIIAITPIAATLSLSTILKQFNPAIFKLNSAPNYVKQPEKIQNDKPKEQYTKTRGNSEANPNKQKPKLIQALLIASFTNHSNRHRNNDTTNSATILPLKH